MRAWLRDHEPELLMLGCAAIFIAVMVCGGPAKAAPVPFAEREALNRTRGCIFTATQVSISTSTTSAASSQLAADSVYYMTCSADTHIRFAPTSGPTAVTTDIQFWGGMWLPVVTGGTNGRYVAGILASGTGTCRLILCE